MKTDEKGLTTVTDVTRLTAAEMAAKLADGSVTSVELTQAHLDRIASVDGSVHAFLHVNSEEALAAAKQADEDRAAGRAQHELTGVPVAVKDLLCTVGSPTTAGSKILEGWVPPYDATVVAKLREAGMPILGKTNLDEFAMGSSTEHSAYGPTRNPWSLEHSPGGSGGGSAAAVAAFEAPLAIGTDTGGSIRQPASLTGTVGVKPTYGAVSRYGIIAMASSLDQAGPCTRSVLDAALLHDVIGGHDEMDSTSIDAPVSPVVEAARAADVKGLKVGIIEQFDGDGFESGVKARFEEGVEALRAAGAEVVTVSCPNLEQALAAYYLIMPSEVSSNLARFDAMRYGLRVAPDGVDSPSAEQVMAASRDAGFGNEVKRRVILGTYALSSGYYDAYYGQAQKVRTLIARDFARAFEQVDVLVSPTAPTTAFKLGEKLEDPMAMYLGDIATIPANLVGLPGISLPAGLSDDGLPVGFQILAPATKDERVYGVGAALEKALEAKWGGPLLAQAPALKENN